MILLDASAILALVLGEPAGDKVAAAAEEATVATPNWAEVLEKARRAGLVTTTLSVRLVGLGMRPVSVDREDAEVAASLWKPGGGLSLADRFCIAVGRRLDLPIWTCDRAWAGVDERVVVLR